VSVDRPGISRLMIRKERTVMLMNKNSEKAGGNNRYTGGRKTNISAGFVVFLLFLSLVIYPISAYATAPKDLKLVYDSNAQTLHVTITHQSPVPTFHYIKKVEIKKNGEVVSTNIYKNQPDKSTFSYTYTIPAEEGDVFEVTASCNLWGSKTEKVTIGKNVK
jgi:hypothetical protein